MIDWKKKKNVMQYYNRISSTYNILYANEQRIKIETILKHLSLDKKFLILDLGCGTGFLFSHLNNNVKSIIGIDISRKLLEQAKRDKSHYTNIHTILADFDHLPFKNKLFNLIFAITVIQNSPHPSDTLQEIKRVSKIQTKIVITGLKKKFTKNNFKHFLQKNKLKILLTEDKDVKDYIAVCIFK